MRVESQCPECGRLLLVREDELGTRRRCPYCRQEITLARPEAEPGEPARRPGGPGPAPGPEGVEALLHEAMEEETSAGTEPVTAEVEVQREAATAGPTAPGRKAALARLRARLAGCRRAFSRTALGLSMVAAGAIGHLVYLGVRPGGEPAHLTRISSPRDVLVALSRPRGDPVEFFAKLGDGRIVLLVLSLGVLLGGGVVSAVSVIRNRNRCLGLAGALVAAVYLQFALWPVLELILR